MKEKSSEKQEKQESGKETQESKWQKGKEIIFFSIILSSFPC